MLKCLKALYLQWPEKATILYSGGFFNAYIFSELERIIYSQITN